MGRYVSLAATSTGSIKSGQASKVMFRATGSTQTWTVPSGVCCVTMEIWGGGGAGAPSCCCTCWGGTAGGGGAYSMKTLAVTPGSTYTIVVGTGGCGSACSWQSNACGCPGTVSYVTGSGLTNFCAEGGYGGYWCDSSTYNGCIGASNAYGGDLNLRGRGTAMSGCLSGCGQMGITGSSPMGGGFNWTTGTGACGDPGSCAQNGQFPGGGGGARPMFGPGWCDCCAGCNGAGADGLVLITL